MKNLLDKVLKELAQARGLDLHSYRRDTLERRLAVRLRALPEISPSKYINFLSTSPTEYDQLIHALTVQVSSFFRNPILFEILAQTVLPELIQAKQKKGSRELRFWSAGCSYGEEAYSLAILIREALKKEFSQWTLLIFGTDISQKAIDIARTATFPRESFENTKLGILDRYFRPVNNEFEVRPFIRKMVNFSVDDLTFSGRMAPAESIFGGFDLVLCRNVLIYFSSDLQNKVFTKLYRSLSTGGYLALGSSESLVREMKPRFKTIDAQNSLFRKLGNRSRQRR